MSSTILLKNGIVLEHSSDQDCPTVQVRHNTDVLIQNDLIKQVGKDIQTPPSAEVIDCTDKIVSPGFVSTHSHLWQSQLKGVHADDTLFDYMPKGAFITHVYTPSDIYWGQLAGCLEAINHGTTTALDHAHGCKNNEDIDAAVQATMDSGLRCTWACADPFRFQTWTKDECVPLEQFWDDKTTAHVEELARKYNKSGGLLDIGMGMDLWFLPPAKIQPLVDRVASAGVRTITTHVGRNLVQGYGMTLSLIKNNAPYLFSDGGKSASGNEAQAIENLVLSHCTNLPPEEHQVLFPPNDEANSNVRPNISISTTPDTESHMAMNRSVAFSPQSSCPVPSHKVSLGIDCHSSNSSYMPHAARNGLANVRTRFSEKLLADGQKYPRQLPGKSGSEVFNSFTVNGAKSLGLDHDNGGIGRIRAGRKADLVILNAGDSINMGVCGLDYDPVVAVTRFSEISDVDTVIIDGKVKKRDGKLVAIDVTENKDLSIIGQKNAGWPVIKQKLFGSYKDIRGRIDKLDIGKCEEAMIGVFHIDMSKMVDSY